jgi:hypothetical protein
MQVGEVRTSFHLRYFSAPYDYFMKKELSQNFAPIPGGPHGTNV